MKQTAIEWLANELLYLDNEFDMMLIDKNEYQVRRKEIINQAKAMEKEYLYDFYMRGGINAIIEADENVEDYYNETFKSE